jgi:hypothetical protein
VNGRPAPLALLPGTIGSLAWINPAHVVEVSARFGVVIEPERRSVHPDAPDDVTPAVLGDTVTIAVSTSHPDRENAGQVYVVSRDRETTLEFLAAIGVPTSDLTRTRPEFGVPPL